MKYILVKASHGFIITTGIESNTTAIESYAFTTLKEVQAYLPKLFKDEGTNERANQHNHGKKGRKDA